MPTCTRGLTLGKYAPFHKGHQLVIETALSEVDELIVVIYDAPEVTDVPLPTRAGWVRRLYPTVKVIEAWGGPAEVGDTPRIKRLQEAFVIETLGISGITHFYSSEFYGEHMSQALGAINRIVDKARNREPVSATMIRSNPYRFRNFLDPVVYRDIVRNVVFLGAPSTGKTTLAEHLAALMNTIWMPEYGREYWDTHQVERRLSLDQLVEIAEGHLEREEHLLTQANRVLFTDTNALTTYQFSLYYHGTAIPRLAERAAQAASRYDLVFVCDTDIPYDATWDRSGDVQRQTFQARILADLHIRKIPYYVVRGDLATRTQLVLNALDRHPHHRNVLESFAL